MKCLTSRLYFFLIAPLILNAQTMLTRGMSARIPPTKQSATPAPSAFCPAVTQGANQAIRPAWGGR